MPELALVYVEKHIFVVFTGPHFVQLIPAVMDTLRAGRIA